MTRRQTLGLLNLRYPRNYGQGKKHRTARPARGRLSRTRVTKARGNRVKRSLAVIRNDRIVETISFVANTKCKERAMEIC